MIGCLASIIIIILLVIVIDTVEIRKPDMHRVKHVIWDWNGTLYDDPHVCVATLNIILARRNLSPVDLDQYREIFRFPVKTYYEEIGFDFSREDWDAMAKEFHLVYSELREADNTGLRNGAEDTLAELETRGVPMSVLSAAETSMLKRDLVQHNIMCFFSYACGTSDIYAGSKVQAGRRLISDIGCEPQNILLVGDTTHDHDVALELGCRCVLLAGGHQAEHRLRKCGRKVIASPAEVTALC